MRNLFYFVLLCVTTVCTAQPTGKLFWHASMTSEGFLGYTQYPQEQPFIIDTVKCSDLKIAGNKLLVAGDKIFSYDVNTLQLADSFDISYPAFIGYENNNLVVARSQPPFLKVYNLSTKNLIFSLDTGKVSQQPVDMLVDGGKVYLLFDTTITIVDIALQDTLATRTATYNSWFPCFNQYLINGTDKIYIHVGIATGAPRFAVLSIHKTSFHVQELLFQEFVDAYYRPVLVGNNIYMSYFPSYYDIAADTFIFDGTQLDTYPLEYDSNSNSLFLYNPLSLNISFYYNSIFSMGFLLPGYLIKSVYYNEGIAAVQSNTIEKILRIYPNPVIDKLHIDLNDEQRIRSLKIFSLTGQSAVYDKYYNSGSCVIDVTHLMPGVYFVEIETDNFIMTEKFVKIYK